MAGISTTAGFTVSGLPVLLVHGEQHSPLVDDGPRALALHAERVGGEHLPVPDRAGDIGIDDRRGEVAQRNGRRLEHEGVDGVRLGSR